MGESSVDGGEKVDSIVDTRRSGFWKSVATEEETRVSRCLVAQPVCNGSHLDASVDQCHGLSRSDEGSNERMLLRKHTA